MAKRLNPNQIIRIDAKNTFMEVVNDSFSLGKVQINFCKYNEKTKKQILRIEIYLSFDKARVLVYDILSGRLDKRISDAKEAGSFEQQKINSFTSYFTDMGGINFSRNGGLGKWKFEKNRKMYPWIEEGKVLSRQFKIMESTKYKYLFLAECGLGTISSTGLIIPEGYPKETIKIPLTEENALELALGLKEHLEAFTNQYYQKFGDTLFKKQECNIFIKPKKEE